MFKIAVCDACRADVELLEQAMDGVSSCVVDYDVYFSTAELLDHVRSRKESYHICVGCRDILYIEKKGRQAVICTVREIYTANMNIKELWKQLDRQSFVQIHLSYIVNLGHIRAVDRNEVLFDNGIRLAVARSRKQELKESFLVFILYMVEQMVKGQASYLK